MQIPLVKLKAILRYFCTKTNSALLGKTKLMKLFYFIDFEHVKRYGTPITFDHYVKLEHGPIPSKIMNLVSAVVDEGENAILADTISIQKSDGMDLQRITCLKSFSEEDKDLFSENEMKVLERVCKKYKDSTARQLEEISHSEAPWTKTNDLDEIPYTLAAEDPDSLVDKEVIELSSKIFP